MIRATILIFAFALTAGGCVVVNKPHRQQRQGAHHGHNHCHPKKHGRAVCHSHPHGHPHH
jgi:hypothetical protein